MNKLIYLFSLIFISLSSFAQTFPEKPDHLVTDYTHTLSDQQTNLLERKLVAFDDSTSTQIAVVIIKSLDGYEVADYGVRLAQKWGIGGKKNNNGVLLLVSLGDRKVTIQTGYGVEGALPDAIARRIIEKEIKPSFKEGNYYQGLEQGTDAIIAYTKGEYKNDNPRKGNGVGRGIFLILLIIIVIVIISRINKGGGGGSQVIGSRGEASPFWWILLGSILGGSGRGNSGWGGGSSSDGGGFGGFGGGGFGGGGASGDW
jgi:uncharacterized protein